MPDKYQNQIQDKRLDNLERDVREIKDNHLPHIIRKITKTGTDVDWLKRFFWIVATASIRPPIEAILNLFKVINKFNIASIGGLIGAILNLLITLNK